MRPSIRIFVLVLLAAVYWVGAAALIVIFAWGIPGDCGLEHTSEGVAACVQEGQLVLLIGVAVALSVYSVAVWKIARRQ